jgi:hypothetical protein
LRPGCLLLCCGCHADGGVFPIILADEDVLVMLKSMSPPALDIEIRTLAA